MADGELGDLTDQGVVVDVQIAEDNDLTIGSEVVMTGPTGASRTLTVEALSDDTVILGFFTVTRATGEGLFPQQLDMQVFGDVDDGRDVDAVLADIEDAVAATPGLDVLDRDAFAGDLADQISSFVNFIYGLLALSVVIAVIGVVNTLLLSIHERTREFGLLRAVGMLRPQLRSAVRWEALLIAVLGTIGGLGAGLAISRVLVQSLEAFGLTTFAVPVGGLVSIVVGAVVLGLLAAVYPAWRASRLDVLDAIATE
jgi:putative ABC transport system permease protein